MKTTLLIILLFLPMVLANAQEDVPELITDRPDQTESSSVVPHKSLQIETGFILANDADDLTEVTAIDYNSTLLRYGLLESMELRLGLAFLGEKVKVKANDSTYSNNGFSPLYAGFKLQVARENGWMPEIAFIGGLFLPFSADEAFKPQNTGADFRFAFAHTLSDRFSFGYNVGVQWEGDESIPIYTYTVALGIGITDWLGAYIEAFGDFPEEGNSTHMADGGFTFLVLPNLQFDISGGIALNEEALDNYFGVGLSYRIPR